MSLANPSPAPPAEAGHVAAGGAGGTVALAMVGGVVTAEAFRRAILNLRRQLVASLLIGWSGFVVDLADLGRSVANFGVVGAALVDGAQRRAVALADVYVSSVLGTPPTGLDPAPFLGPSVPAPMSVVLAGPPLATVRMNLANGQPPEVALNRGKYRATRVAETEVQRSATDAVANLAGGRSPGWIRHLGDAPCPICRALATGEVQPWPAAKEIAAHPLCSCVAEVVPG